VPDSEMLIVAEVLVISELLRIDTSGAIQKPLAVAKAFISSSLKSSL